MEGRLVHKERYLIFIMVLFVIAPLEKLEKSYMSINRKMNKALGIFIKYNTVHQLK